MDFAKLTGVTVPMPWVPSLCGEGLLLLFGERRCRAGLPLASPSPLAFSAKTFAHWIFFWPCPCGVMPLCTCIYMYTRLRAMHACVTPPNPHLPILWAMPGLSPGTCWGKMCFEGKLQNAVGGKKQSKLETTAAAAA